MRSSTTAPGTGCSWCSAHARVPAAAKTGTGADTRTAALAQTPASPQIPRPSRPEIPPSHPRPASVPVRPLARGLDLLRVMPRPIAPMHAPQHRIRSRLQRQMRMPRQPTRRLPSPAKLRHQPDQLRIPIHRLDRTQPQPRQAPSPRKSAAPARQCFGCPILRVFWRKGGTANRCIPASASEKSRPHRPRLIPESTSSLPPAATKPCTCRSTFCGPAGFSTSPASAESRKTSSGFRNPPGSSGSAASAPRRTTCASSRNECAKRSSASTSAWLFAELAISEATLTISRLDQIQFAIGLQAPAQSPAPMPYGCCQPPQPPIQPCQLIRCALRIAARGHNPRLGIQPVGPPDETPAPPGPPPPSRCRYSR